MPLSVLAGVLIRRGTPTGYLTAFPLLGILVLLGPTFVAQTISQIFARVEFTTAEIVGPLAGFGAVALLAVWVTISLLRAMPAHHPTYPQTTASASWTDPAAATEQDQTRP